MRKSSKQGNKKKQILKRIVNKRFKRSLRILFSRRKIRKIRLKKFLAERNLEKRSIPIIEAPEMLALAPSGLTKKEYIQATEHTRFVQFKEKLWEASEKATREGINKIHISFVNTRMLYADACILLIATLDSIKAKYPQLRFSIKRPDNRWHNHKPKRDKHKQFYVDDVFCHVGLYKLLGFDYQPKVYHKNVQSWHYVFSDEFDGSITEPIFQELDKMGLKNQAELYSGVAEGIANAVEHAYNRDIETEREFPLRRWWMLIAKFDDGLKLYVCDLGHGIPKTLRFRKDPKLLEAIFAKVKHLASTDCKDIKAATLMKETSTGMYNRGKGTQDMKSFVEITKGSSVSIYSNRGTYRYNNGTQLREKVYENKLSINGTLLYWQIPLN